MGLTDEHLFYGDDIPQTEEAKEYYRKLKQTERKTGKWVNEGQYAPYHGEDAFSCSLCGGHVIEYECQVYEMNPYCKWCGAKMEVEE